MKWLIFHLNPINSNSGVCENNYFEVRLLSSSSVFKAKCGYDVTWHSWKEED